MTLDERRAVLDWAISQYIPLGCRLVVRSDINARLAKPKSFNLLFTLLCILLTPFFGIGLIMLLIYMVIYVFQKEDMVYLEIDQYGTLRVTEMGAKPALASGATIPHTVSYRPLLTETGGNSMKPEDLPNAPSPAMDLNYALAILKEARDEPNTVQWVFTRSLISKAAEWGKEMAGKQASLRPMTTEDIRAYIEGFMLPLFSLQAARLSIEEGKDKYLGEIDAQSQSYATDVIKKNLDLLISALKYDPSGVSLLRQLFEMYNEKFPQRYFVKGIELCADTYESYWQYFARFSKEVDLW